MGLAGPRNKRKLAQDPNNTKWSRNETTFGQKILRAHGWEPGKNLGALDAAHASYHTAASSAPIKVVLKDDFLGLGAKPRQKQSDECTGLDVFKDLLGRLNGKSEEVIDKERKARADIKTDLYVQNKYGLMRFVSGGLLVGDQMKESTDKKDETVKSESDNDTKDIKVAVELEEKISSKKDKKDKKRKTEDTEQDEDMKEKLREKKKRKKAAADSDDDSVADEVPKKKKKSKRSKDISESEEDATGSKKKKKEKKGKKSRDIDGESGSAPEDTEDAEKKRKREKKEKKEKKRRKREAEQSASSSGKATPVIDAISGTATPTSTGTSTPQAVSARHYARSRNIASKRQAMADMKSLNQIFMVKPV